LHSLIQAGQRTLKRRQRTTAVALTKIHPERLQHLLKLHLQGFELQPQARFSHVLQNLSARNYLSNLSG
jgi:hypothetical protein